MVAPSIEVDGLNDMLRMLRGAPPELSKNLRRESKAIAGIVADDAQSRARRESKQLAATARTIRAVSDRVPTVKAGGARRVTSSGASASDIYWGANFGTKANRYPQFPRREPGGRTIYPAIRAAREEIADRYLDAVKDVWDGR